MQTLKIALPGLFLVLGSLAQAQTAGTISFSANKTSSTTGFSPVLTWSTSPTASSCAASDGWSGTKFASGSETLAKITSSKSYKLTCAWGGGTATIHWTRPTKNTDGSSLTDLASYKILYGTSASALSNSVTVLDPAATSKVIGALGTGTWYFAVRAVNGSGAESANSNVATRSITAATASKTVNISISGGTTPPPTTKTLQTSMTSVYDAVFTDGVRLLGQKVGTIGLNKPCDKTYKVEPNYYRVSQSLVTLTKTPRSSSVVVLCQYK
jgi:hypothetical protein